MRTNDRLLSFRFAWQRLATTRNWLWSHQCKWIPASRLNVVASFLQWYYAIGGRSSLPLRCLGCRFTRNHCACAPMLYISELCEGCTVENEIDYAWTSIHDNGHMVTACDVILQQRIRMKLHYAKQGHTCVCVCITGLGCEVTLLFGQTCHMIDWLVPFVPSQKSKQLKKNEDGNICSRTIMVRWLGVVAIICHAK